MRLAFGGVLLSIALVACGGGADNATNPNPDPEPEPEPIPAEVVVVNATREAVGLGLQRLTLHLRNDSGPGVYALEVYSLPTLDDPGGVFLGRTEPVEVDAEYDETLIYEVEAMSRRWDICSCSAGTTAALSTARPTDLISLFPCRTEARPGANCARRDPGPELTIG